MPEERATLEEYRRLYRDARGFVAVGDMSPCYLPDEGAAARIQEVSPGARIVAILRDPVARAWSDFLFCRTLGVEPEISFRAALRRAEDRDSPKRYLSRLYIDQGMYADQVRRYQQTFGREQVLVLLFEDLVRKPRELFRRLAQHIGVDPDYFNDADLSEPINQYRMPKQRALVQAVRTLRLQRLLPVSALRTIRPLFFDLKKPRLDDESCRMLEKVYAPDVARLEELLGQELPELRKSWQ